MSESLESLGPETQVLDQSTINTIAPIYDAIEADEKDVALEITTAPKLSQPDLHLESNVAAIAGPWPEQSDTTALLEGHRGDVSKDGRSSKDQDDMGQSNSIALSADCHGSDGKLDKNSKAKLDVEQSSSTALLDVRHANVSKIDNLATKLREERGGDRQLSTLSAVMSLFPVHAAYWIAGGLSLLSCCGGCCLIEMALKKEEVKRRLRARMQVGRSKESAPKLSQEEPARDNDLDEDIQACQNSTIDAAMQNGPSRSAHRHKEKSRSTGRRSFTERVMGLWSPQRDN